MTVDEKAIEAAAEAEARYDGYDGLVSFSRTMRERYIDRAHAAVIAYEAAKPARAEEAWPKDPETGLNDLSLPTLLRKTREEAVGEPELSERDARIVKEWLLAERSHRGRSRLGKLIALRIADELEADGVTEADIDRLFPDRARPATQQKD